MAYKTFPFVKSQRAIWPKLSEDTKYQIQFNAKWMPPAKNAHTQAQHRKNFFKYLPFIGLLLLMMLFYLLAIHLCDLVSRADGAEYPVLFSLFTALNYRGKVSKWTTSYHITFKFVCRHLAMQSYAKIWKDK